MERQIAMSHEYKISHIQQANSDLIRDEQIKVTGCRFASSRERDVKRCFASIRLRVCYRGHAGFNQHGAKRNVV
ncbi:MAG: hypothetical protein ACTSX0_07310 [Promethearchaeota archaeon]